jgi:hypothetical protein
MSIKQRIKKMNDDQVRGWYLQYSVMREAPFKSEQARRKYYDKCIELLRAEAQERGLELMEP